MLAMPSAAPSQLLRRIDPPSGNPDAHRVEQIVVARERPDA
jgi:hypothetical protein